MKNYYSDDYYAILQISPNASPQDIRNAYIKLSKIHHPDVGGDTRIMQLINNAYSILSNPVEREHYNSWYNKQAFGSSNNSDKTYSSIQNVTVHILDYKRGYIITKMPLSQCKSAAESFLYGNEMYAYVINAEEKTISFIERDAFFQMLQLYNSSSIFAIIINNKKYYREEIDTSILENNYRKYIEPYTDKIYILKIKKKYYAISKSQFEHFLETTHITEATPIKKTTIIKRAAIFAAIALFMVMAIRNSPESDTAIQTQNSTDPELYEVLPPPNNTVEYYADSDINNFTIETTYSENNRYYFIKICKPNTTTAVQTVFIHAGNTAELYVPNGTYEVKWVSGNSWYGKEYNFNNHSAQKADDLFTFDDEHIWTIKLYPVYNGNLGTDTIDIENF